MAWPAHCFPSGPARVPAAGNLLAAAPPQCPPFPPQPHLLKGRHTVISTSTASGKSLCYNIPVLEALAADPTACALYM